MNDRIRRSMLLVAASVSVSFCFVLAGCSHNSNGLIASSLDCSDAAIAKSDHASQLRMDCEAAQDARAKEFRKTHDCNLDTVITQPNPDQFEANCNGKDWDGQPNALLQQYKEQKAQNDAMTKQYEQKEAADKQRRAAAKRKLEDSCIPEMVKAKVSVATYRRCEPIDNGRVLFNQDTDIVSNDRQQAWLKIAQNRKAGGQ